MTDVKWPMAEYVWLVAMSPVFSAAQKADWLR
jgi:hypothetical protein